MQKLMKNWIFTMITCALLAILATLMILDGLDVGGLRIADRMIHLVVAIALVIYVAFTLFPLTVRYRGVLRAFVLGETAVLLLTAFAHICMEWIDVPLISSMQVCAVLGLALWLRAVVETVHAYFSGVGECAPKRMPLWKLLFYILLAAVGVWQMARPLISDRTFIFVIGGAAAVMAVLFGCITYTNRKASAPAREAKKKKKAAERAALSAATAAAALPAATKEQAAPTEGEQKE